LTSAAAAAAAAQQQAGAGAGISDLDAVQDPFGFAAAPTPGRPGLRPLPRYDVSETVPI
jgi:hypothetical protein